MINQSLLLAGDDQYQIARSLRFNSADSAYLNRTPASAGNRKTGTLSLWLKRGNQIGTTTRVPLFYADSGSNYDLIGFTVSGSYIDKIDFTNTNGTLSLISSAVFRDPSSWYHIVVAWDTTQVTASNRIKIYINGTQLTAFDSSGYPAQNRDMSFSAASTLHYLGYSPQSTTYFNGYLTEVNFIDGQALTPSSFGETDAATGVWKPKKYTGTYGTNGFYLNFSDNSGTTSTTLGKDSSGNGNNWTPNNFSVTAGVGNDSLVDTPTPYGSDTGAGGEVRGNYATWNPLDKRISGASTFANGNLDATVGSSGSTEEACATITFPSSGSWYCEVTCTNVASGNARVGIANIAYPIDTRNANGYLYQQDGQKYVLGTASAYGSSYTTGDVIGIAFDASAGSITFYKNNTSQGAITGVSTTASWIISTTGKATVWTLNAGQRPFAYTAPSGYKALCTQNLPTPTIGATASTQAGKYFDATLYTGTSASQSVTNAGAFQPDLVWLKSRSTANSHFLGDSVRGFDGSGYYNLQTNTTNAELTGVTNLTAINSNGFTLGSNAGTNGSGENFVAWQWNAGGSNATNTAGSITSTVRANASAGFSIVTYTGTGANATVGHGLGVAPKMIIIKQRTASSTTNWIVWHTSTAGYSWYLKLNLTDAQNGDTTVFQAAASSTTFSIGSNSAVNANNGTYVAYCFAPVAGYSAFGTWQNNNSTDGTFIYLGFRPRFILLKNTDNTERWFIWDSARQTYNMPPPSSNFLNPNTSNAEGANNADTAEIDGLSNGFKIRTTNPANGEISFGTRSYIYAAFAESPFKYALAR